METKHVFRSIGPYTIVTGSQKDGAEALVEVTIRRDKLGMGTHAEDLMFELANLVADHLAKRNTAAKA